MRDHLAPLPQRARRAFALTAVDGGQKYLTGYRPIFGNFLVRPADAACVDAAERAVHAGTTVKPCAISVRDEYSSAPVDRSTEVNYRGMAPIMSVAAGGFERQGDTLPDAAVAWSSYQDVIPEARAAGGAPRRADTGWLTGVELDAKTPGPAAIDVKGPPVLLAHDRLGASQYIGPPTEVHYGTIGTLQQVLQEPPKHLDFIPEAAPGVREGWEDPTRNPNWFVGFDTSAKTTQQSTTKTNTDVAVGVSVGGVAKAKIEVGEKKLKNEASFALEAKGKVSDQLKAEADEDTSAKAVSETRSERKTTNDDQVIARYQSLTVFRYPVIGAERDGGTPVYDVLVPGGVTTYDGSADGLGAEWAPSYENGNIMSYPAGSLPSVDDAGAFVPLTPAADGTCGRPADLTPLGFTVASAGVAPLPPVTDGIASQSTDLLNESEDSFSYEAETENACGVATTQKLTAEASLKETIAGEAGIPGLGELAGKVSFETEIEGETAWGQTQTAVRQSVQAKELSLVRGKPGLAGEAGAALQNSRANYAVGSRYYIAKSGAEKVVHSVAGRSGAFWTDRYNRPDPALNMAKRIVTGEPPKWNDAYDRTFVRDITVTHPESDPLPIQGGALVGTIADGDVVQIDVPVHNYGLKGVPTATPVELALQPFDPGSPYVSKEAPKVITCKASTPAAPITTSDGSSPAGRISTATCLWDTKGATAEGDLHFRIWATLRPTGDVAVQMTAQGPRRAGGRRPRRGVHLCRSPDLREVPLLRERQRVPLCERLQVHVSAGLAVRPARVQQDVNGPHDDRLALQPDGTAAVVRRHDDRALLLRPADWRQQVPRQGFDTALCTYGGCT